MKVKDVMHKGVDWVSPQHHCHRTRENDAGA
jgi:hypothetical protein